VETRQPLIAFDEEHLRAALNEMGQPAYRASQVLGWLKKGKEIQEMENLPQSLRNALSEAYTAFALTLQNTVSDPKSGTKKHMYLCNDDIIIESVNLAYRYGGAQCISTQAGCNMHCLFCVSGKYGLNRSLSCGEMLSQLLIAQRGQEEKIGNVVLMGSGEPLDNYDEVRDFLTRLTDPSQFGYSKRRVTLSTCGIVPGIYQMIKDKLFVSLAVSLHAPTHEMRKTLMPVENKYPLASLLEAVKAYCKASSSRATLEYAVIEGLNDTAECAADLRKITHNNPFLVNLIGINEGSGRFRANTKGALDRFSERLKAQNVPHTIRRSLGSSINAACGQLAGYSWKT